MVGVEEYDSPVFAFVAQCSIQLNYTPIGEPPESQTQSDEVTIHRAHRYTSGAIERKRMPQLDFASNGIGFSAYTMVGETRWLSQNDSNVQSTLSESAALPIRLWDNEIRWRSHRGTIPKPSHRQ